MTDPYCADPIIMQVVPGQKWADNSIGRFDRCCWERSSGVHCRPDHCNQGGKEEQRDGEKLSSVVLNMRRHLHV